MKILKMGNKEKVPKRFRFKCGNCTCVFECSRDEVRFEPGKNKSIHATCDCPTCGKTLNVDV